jgi:trehalose 6-phosphate phosphatase
MTATEPMHRMPGRLSPGNIGLFLDVDGTLLDIAPRPEAVEVPPGLLDDLAALELALGGALALVSGRPIAQLDRLFAPLRLAAGGVHGAELRRQPHGPVALLADGRLGDNAWSALSRLLRDYRGSYAENKEVSFAVHYPDPGTDIDRLERDLLRLKKDVATPDRPLRLIAGHAVFELQLDGFDKGQVIGQFMSDQPFRGRQPIFIGDDEIDRAAFDATLAMGGLAFSVGTTLPGLSGRFAGPGAVRDWLHGLAR